MKKKLPEFLRPYFWDVDFEKLDYENQSFYVIERLLNKGNLETVQWMTKTYSEDQIKTVLKKGRDLSLKNASFWGLLFGVPNTEILCFQEPYYSLRRTLWPY